MTVTEPTTAGLRDLLARLDLPAKVRLLTGASAFGLHAEPAVGLAALQLSDGPTGVRGPMFIGGPQVALLPNATLIAATWSEDVAQEVGRLLAEEAIAQGVHVVLGPTINLHRSVLGGRLFEAFSEDPLLTGRLAAAYVRGLQGAGVAATPKHLVGNESETQRTTVDSVIDEATLRELYLLPFEIVVAQAHPWTMMAAYNDVNGVPATEQEQVNLSIVKGEWGWDGLLMSDWFATTSTAAAAAGLDLVMPGPDGPWGQALVDAVRAGQVAEAAVDDHVLRLLRLAARVGALAGPGPRAHENGEASEGDRSGRGRPFPAPDSPQRRSQLERLAARGMTVLTNRSRDDGEPVLPLARGTTVALIGRHAVETVCMGGGSAAVNPPHQVSVADGLRARLGEATVGVVDGVEVRHRPAPARPGFAVDPVTGGPGVRFWLLGPDDEVLAERVAPGASTTVGVDDVPARLSAVRLRARIPSGGRIEIGTVGVGDWTLSAAGRTWQYRSVTSGTGFAEELLSPPGHSEIVRLEPGEQVEALVRWGGPGGASIGGAGLLALIARPAPRDPDAVIAEAVEAAAAADVAVVVVGLTEQDETESVDKSTLRLPGRQDDLVEAVADAARRTVVVVNAATPVLMPWRHRVDAVLWAGLPGQEGGHAVAAALLGEVEPAGRLVTTFPAADGAAPAWSVTPVDGQLRYTEGTFIGYRGHAAGRAHEPAFWFGHGLGYGRWEYGDVRLADEDATPDGRHDLAPDGTHGGGPAVWLRVTNTGSRTSREVVQVYLRPAEPDQPVRLVGWTAVEVAAGEQAQVEVRTDVRMWRRWDQAAHRWTRLAPGGELLVARGLGDLRARLRLTERD